MAKKEQMLHPFTSVPCDVQRLAPGDTIEEGDVYRSMTLKSKNSELGAWQMATTTLAGTIVGKECNVGFIRLTPTVVEGIDTGT